jgi:hypothetical protein
MQSLHIHGSGERQAGRSLLTELTLLPAKWRQHTPLKRLHPVMRIYGITIKKEIVYIYLFQINIRNVAMLEEKKLVDKDVAWRNFKISISII